MGQMMSTSELAKYLKLHPMTVLKYAKKGTIPGKRLERVWRFEKEVIDRWVAGDGPNPEKKKKRGKP